MLNLATIVAHVVKLGITMICMKHFKDSYSIYVSDQAWATRAFQIQLAHSILGILRFGSPQTSKSFRSFYIWFSNLANIVPFVLLTMEILHQRYIGEEKIRLTLLTLTCLPIVYELVRKERNNLRLTDLSIGLQLLAITFVCIQNSNYNVISLVVSYAFTYYLLEEFCDRYDVPYIDLTQYSLCFTEIFAILTLKDL